MFKNLSSQANTANTELSIYQIFDGLVSLRQVFPSICPPFDLNNHFFMCVSLNVNREGCFNELEL